MDGELQQKYDETSKIKDVILENANIDILLYLAKYNPKVTKSTIVKSFGKESLKGLKDLEKVNLVREEDNKLTLTNEGIFQVDGLISMVC